MTKKVGANRKMRVAVALIVLGSTSCSTNPSVQGGAIRASGPADSVAWVAGTDLPSGRDHHGTFITTGGRRAWLWVVGGNDYKTMMSETWRAPIIADGSLGTWSAGPSLPAKNAGMGVAANHRFVILSGGQDSTLRKKTEIFVARVGADGMLGPWSQTGNLPGPRFHHASLVDGRFLYVIGGLERAVSVATVLRGTIGSDGSITHWDSLPALPRPRSHQSIFVHNRAIYIVGGLDGNPAGANTPLADVLRSTIKQDGSLGAWEEVGKLDNAYATHATAVYGGAVWLFGGVEDNARFVDAVLRAPIAADGKVGPWKKLASGLPAARSHVHQAPVHGNRVYSTGGSNRRVVTPEVQVGTFIRIEAQRKSRRGRSGGR